MTGFIFGGNTPWSYEELQKKRTIAEELVKANMSTPRNVGEGLNAIGRALAFRSLDKKASKRDAELKGEFQSQWDGAFGGYGSGASGGGQAFAPPSMSAPMPPVDPNNPHALGDDAMAALGKPAVKTAADPAAIKAGLVARGLPEHVAEGFVMNMKDESGLNPGINEIAPLVPGSRGGFGLYQLTGPRRVAYEKFAAERGVPADDVDAQLDFLMTELQGPEAKAAGAILSTKTPGEAGAAIVNNFLRPSPEYAASRAANYLGQPAQGGGMDLAQIAELAGNPYATPGQKAVLAALMQQQMDAMDPMRAIEMQKAQLELAQMQNPQAEPVDYDTFNGPDGTVYRFNPATGEAEPITGGKAGPRPMTAEERTQWGIPETDKTPYKMTDAGPVAISGGGTTINNNMDGDKFAEAFAKGDAATVETVYNSGLAAQRNIGRIDQLEGLLAASPTGFEGAAKLKAGEWGIETEGLDDLQAAQALINSLVPEQRQPGSGPMSDADLALFKQSLPRIINQPGGNQMIVSTMRAIAQYDAEGAAIVQKMRTGELDRAGAFAALQGRKNPLADLALPPPIAGGGADVSDDDAEYLRSLGLEP